VANVSDEEMQEHYDNFFEDVFVECEDKYGEIEEMNVCDNLGDHLVGNVYIKFRNEEEAAAVEVAAVDGINYSGHFFNTVAIERESNGQATTPSIVYFILCVSFPRFFISL